MRVLWSCRGPSQGARALAWARVCVSACVHLCACVHACACVCARVCARAGKEAGARSTRGIQHSPGGPLSISCCRRPAPGRPLGRAGVQAQRAGRGGGRGGWGWGAGGREEGGRAGGRRIREARQLFDRSQGSRRGRGGPQGAGRAAG